MILIRGLSSTTIESTTQKKQPNQQVSWNLQVLLMLHMVDTPCEPMLPEAWPGTISMTPLAHWMVYHAQLPHSRQLQELKPSPCASCQSAGVALARALLGVVGGGGAFMSMAAVAGEGTKGNLLLDSGVYVFPNVASKQTQ